MLVELMVALAWNPHLRMISAGAAHAHQDIMGICVRTGMTHVTLFPASMVGIVLPWKMVHFFASVRKVILGSCVTRRVDRVFHHLAAMVELALKVVPTLPYAAVQQTLLVSIVKFPTLAK